MLSDADQVRNLLGIYCERIDAGDFDGVGELFAHASLAAGDGPPFATGAAAISAFYRSGTRLHAGSPRTKHLVSGTVVDEVGERMVARSSFVVLQAVDGFPLQPIIAGRYVDTFEPTPDGAWRWGERRFHVDLVGDLSHHLADPGIATRARPEDVAP